MSSYRELEAIYDIDKQIDQILEKVQGMKQLTDVFSLDSVIVENLETALYQTKESLVLDASQIEEIKEREQTNPLLTDPMIYQQRRRSIFSNIRKYRTDILPEYQKLVVQLLENEDQIQSNVEQKRDAGEVIPEKEKITDAINNAKEKLDEALANETLLNLNEMVGNFAKKVEPYIKPILEASSILINLFLL